MLLQSLKNVVKLVNIQTRQYAVRRMPEKFNQFCLPVKFDAKLTAKLRNDRVITVNDWFRVRRDLLKFHANSYVNEHNVDKIMLGYCAALKNIDDQLLNAINYMNALINANIEPSIACCSKVLNIFYRKALYEKLSDSEEEELLKLCQSVDEKLLLETKPDRDVFRNLLLALSVTKKWRHVMRLIEATKEDSPMGKPPAMVYKMFVIKAFSEDDDQLGWKMLDEIGNENILIDARVFSAYWDYCRRKQSNMKENLERMMTFISTNKFIVTKEVVDGLTSLVGGKKHECNDVIIDDSGICGNCKHLLPAPDNLAPNEFSELQNTMKEKLNKEQKIFQRTTPEELNRFMTFLAQKPAFDVVIDGYAVATFHRQHFDPMDRADILKCVIDHFVDQNKRVLTIGRKCMELWPPKALELIQKNAEVYFVDDYAKDDPYVLYAALSSSLTCEMLAIRPPHFEWMTELNEYERSYLQRWQQWHQLILKNSSDKYSIVIKHQPIQQELVPRKIEKYWHLPYLQQAKSVVKIRDLNETPCHMWFCFKVE